MTEKNVRLGIIGFGAQGTTYAGFIADGRVEGMSLGAICDIDAEKKALAAEKHPGVPFYEDYIAMLDSGDVDAVVTAVPHFDHPELTITAIEIGRASCRERVEISGVDESEKKNEERKRAIRRGE